MKKDHSGLFGIFGIALAFIVSFAMPDAASAVGFEAAAGIWQQNISGDLSSEGESLDAEDELGYDDETKAFGRLKVITPPFLPNLYLTATAMKFSGDGQKNVQFTFGDQTFDANVPFSSELRLNHYDICLYYGIPFLKVASAGRLNAEVGLNARIVDLEAEISQTNPVTGTVKETESLTIPVPMVYAGIQFNPVKLIGLEAEARGIAYSDNHYFELIGRVKVRPVGPLFLAGGYRAEFIKIDHDDVEADLDVSGPFAEIGVEF